MYIPFIEARRSASATRFRFVSPRSFHDESQDFFGRRSRFDDALQG
jgi:hypothetical protein